MSVAELIAKRSYFVEVSNLLMFVECLVGCMAACAVLYYIIQGDKLTIKGSFYSVLLKAIIGVLVAAALVLHFTPSIIDKRIIEPITDTLKKDAENRDEYVVLFDGKETTMTIDEAYDYKSINSNATILDDTTIKALFIYTKPQRSSSITIMAPIAVVLCICMLGGVVWTFK